MAFKAFRGQAFSHSHENVIFNQLYDLLQATWQESPTPLYLFGNFFVSGREFDALIFKDNAIIVVDFKNYGGEVSFSENGSWYCDDQEIKGGSSKNPYLQIRQNKFALLDFLKQDSVDISSNPNLGHISGLALFHQAIEFDENSLPISIKTWFHLSDINHAVRTIDAIASKAINLSISEIDAIAAAFGINEYFPDGKPVTRSLIATDAKAGVLAPLASQQCALDAVESWLDSNTAIFTLKGMVSTGKKSLLPHLIYAAKQRNLLPLLLAPNTRLAAKYSAQGYGDFISIYQALYSPTSDGTVKKDNGLELTRYPISLNEDKLQRAFVVIVEAHLISDSYYDLDTAIYGSGHLISDLLDAFGSCLPKTLIVGDPYQLSRGDLKQSLLNTTLFNEKHLPSEVLLLTQQIESEPLPMRAFQFELAQSLHKQHFIALPEPDEVVIKRANSSAKIGEDITNQAGFAVYLCATHQTVHKINHAAKTKVLKHLSGYELQPNDLVDFHNSSPAISDVNNGAVGDMTSWINAGEIIPVIRVLPDIETIHIKLSGRNEDTLVRLGRFTCKNGAGQEICLFYLVDYLSNERPELTADQVLALSIEARKRIEHKYLNLKQQLEVLKEADSEEYKTKRLELNALIQREMASSPILNAAKIRFAYAMTVHRAQGRQWAKTYIDASRSPSGTTFNNDAYFRYLYTASLCAEDSIAFVKFPDLSPMVNCIYKDNPNCVIGAFPISSGFMFERSFEDNQMFALLDKFSGTAESIVNMYKTVDVRLQGSGWRIVEVVDHSYQLQFSLQHSQQKPALLRLHYDKNFVVNTISFNTDTDTSAKQHLSELLASKYLFDDKRLLEAAKALNEFCSKFGFELVKATSPSEWEVQVWVVSADDALLVKAWVGKDGFVSTVMPSKATSIEVVSRFKSLFDMDKGN